MLEELKKKLAEKQDYEKKVMSELVFVKGQVKMLEELIEEQEKEGK